MEVAFQGATLQFEDEPIQKSLVLNFVACVMMARIFAACSWVGAKASPLEDLIATETTSDGLSVSVEEIRTRHGIVTMPGPASST
jgi:hypothetical protein